MKKICYLLLLLGIFQNITAQEAKNELGSWYILASNSDITNKINVQAQTQFRFFELASELQQFKIRVGATYKISETFKTGIGYGYFKNDPSYLLELPQDFNEHRLVIDAHLTNNFTKFKLQHRYRFEQRFLEDRENAAWIRYMLKGMYKITSTIAVDVYDEVFLNLQGDSFFAQNWLGGGVNYSFSEVVKARLGFQNIQTEGDDFNRILIGVTFTPNFRNFDK